MCTYPSILRLNQYDHEQEVLSLDWSDEKAISYHIAVNCLHNNAVGKMQEFCVEYDGLCQRPEHRKSTQKKKSLKFMDKHKSKGVHM